ncbi:MAG: hypothetical protein NT001_04520 [Candidatus Woesearchaeota archaeon]|nr:hypothetical protein [Candidatus Woesearchaeota archaeon]
MEIRINIAKKHFWAIMAVIVLIGAATLVFATGYSSTLASHAMLFADTIRGKTGSTVTVSDNLAVTGNVGVTNGKISGDGSGLTNLKFFLSCEHRRSITFNGDSVEWCDATYPTISFCSVVDGYDGSTKTDADPTSPTILTTCLSNGLCNAGDGAGDMKRANLGSDAAYLEIVTKTGGIEGCWQYDNGHSRTPYRLELICCK